MLICKKCN